MYIYMYIDNVLFEPSSCDPTITYLGVAPGHSIAIGVGGRTSNRN